MNTTSGATAWMLDTLFQIADRTHALNDTAAGVETRLCMSKGMVSPEGFRQRARVGVSALGLCSSG